MDDSESGEEFLSADEGDGDENDAEENGKVEQACNHNEQPGNHDESEKNILCDNSDHVTIVDTNDTFQPESSLYKQSLTTNCLTFLTPEKNIDVCEEIETENIVDAKTKCLQEIVADCNKIDVENLLLENTCIDSNLLLENTYIDSNNLLLENKCIDSNLLLENTCIDSNNLLLESMCTESNNLQLESTCIDSNNFDTLNETVSLSTEVNLSNEQKNVNGETNLEERSLVSKNSEILLQNSAIIDAITDFSRKNELSSDIEKGFDDNLEHVKLLQEKDESVDDFAYDFTNKKLSEKCDIGSNISKKKESSSEKSSNDNLEITRELPLEEKIIDSVDAFEYDSANQPSDVVNSNVGSSISESRKIEVASKSESSEDWGWDSWAEDIIQQATNKVSVLVETLEDKLGIPDPLEMAKFIKEESESNLTQNNLNLVKEKVPCVNEKLLEKSASSSGFSSWLSSLYPITSIVQATGQDLVSGSIGALEFIGKKTVDILSDGDPGLRSVRHKFEKKTLSMVLNDAKLKHELNSQEQNTLPKESSITFDNMFEKYQGSAHLDALVMLSNECERKLQRILAMQSDEVKKESLTLLVSIKEKFQLENVEKCTDEMDFKKDIISLSKKLNLKITFSKLLNTWQKLKDKKEVSESYKHEEEIISVLAELLSRFVEYFRKIADLLILTDVKAKTASEDRAGTLKLLAEMFTNEILTFANTFAEEIAENKNGSSALLSDIYLEASNCATLLQSSYNLLLPILQCSAVK